MKVDWLVVGAGITGATFARRAADSGKQVLMVEKRDHIAGNCYEEDGVHVYGPHLFHTNSRKVWDFLSGYTTWRRYVHRVLGEVDGRLVPIPPNLDTIRALCGVDLPFNDEEVPIERVPGEIRKCLWDKIYAPYTRKQWGAEPENLSSSIWGRIKVRFNRDTRYFSDRWQALPTDGYTEMVRRMLDGIPVLLNTPFERGMVEAGKIFWTGPIDAFFGYALGPLPYRSNEIRLEEGKRQPVATINYPQDGPWTRSTDYSWITGSKIVAWEIPSAEGEPLYPVHTTESEQLLREYRAIFEPDVFFAGRLGSFMYYNMDQAVAQALSIADSVL